jgi:hypothetical protein
VGGEGGGTEVDAQFLCSSAPCVAWHVWGPSLILPNWKIPNLGNGVTSAIEIVRKQRSTHLCQSQAEFVEWCLLCEEPEVVHRRLSSLAVASHANASHSLELKFGFAFRLLSPPWVHADLFFVRKFSLEDSDWRFCLLALRLLLEVNDVASQAVSVPLRPLKVPSRVSSGAKLSMVGFLGAGGRICDAQS